MKRLILSVLILSIIFSLCACSGNVGSQTVISDSDAFLSSDTDTPAAEPLRNENGVLLSFLPMLEQYPDMVGWITVPGTIIDYPVVQGYDNDYFLTHDYKGDENRNGAIYLDFRVRFDYGNISRNVVIHGHHMKSGVMFANLVKYDDPDFFRQNPIVRFDSMYEDSLWVIFAIMKIDAYGGEDGMPTFDFMQCDFADDGEFMEYVGEIRARSIYDTFDIVDVSESDSIITMSTCSYEYDDFRTVLVARRLRPDETSLSFDFSSLDFSEECIMPPVWGEWEGSLDR